MRLWIQVMYHYYSNKVCLIYFHFYHSCNICQNFGHHLFINWSFCFIFLIPQHPLLISKHHGFAFHLWLSVLGFFSFRTSGSHSVNIFVPSMPLCPTPNTERTHNRCCLHVHMSPGHRAPRGFRLFTLSHKIKIWKLFNDTEIEFFLQCFSRNYSSCLFIIQLWPVAAL